MLQEIQVINIKHSSHIHKVEYLGRAMPGREASPLANPFKPSQRGRGETLPQYRIWLWEQLQSDTPQRREIIRLAKRYMEGDELHLACWCKPNPCHADVVKNAILWWRQTYMQS